MCPDLGWALGDGQEHGSDPAWDAAEAEALYERLEREVIPEFYTRNEKGIPVAWVKRMRESMARLTPHFAADRTVREYTEQHYLPAAIACQSRVAKPWHHRRSKWWIGVTAWIRNGHAAHFGP
jgi:starch phosphorylase